jgi:hypothetical protein
VKTIKLYHGELALVDDEDYERLSKIPWHLDNYGYAVNSFRGTNGKMHTAVMGEPPSGKEIHHKDENRINNQKLNLEFITFSSHSHLHRKRKSRMGYRGVHQHGARFRAKIMKNYKTIHLGVFDYPMDAAVAYDEKALELFGSHAKLNFP